MDLDRMTHPLRLAAGSHQPGSDKWCAMNAISFISGDPTITDFPRRSARPLAAFVQLCNDLLAGRDGYLSPEDGMVVLDLGWQTIGTADMLDTVIHAWMSELLTNHSWGVVRYAKITAIKPICDIAELHRKAASGHMPPIAAWDAADRAARAAARAMGPNANTSGLYALRAAWLSTELVHTKYPGMLDSVTGDALRAHALAAEGTARVVQVARDAIQSWRRLAGQDNHATIRPAAGDHRLVHTDARSQP
jgi:hypothetical protein